MDSLEFFLLLTIILVDLGLAFWVLLADKKSKASRCFFCISIFILLWNCFGYLAYKMPKEDLSLLYIRLNLSAVSLFLISFYFFSIYFPSESKIKHKMINIIVAVTGGFFSLAAIFSKHMVVSADILNTKKMTMTTGYLGNAFYGFAVLVTLWILCEMMKKYKGLDKTGKLKIQFLLIGTFLFAMFNVIFNVLIFYIFPENVKLTRLGDFSAIFFLGFTGYAILKHGLFNIKVIATETIVIMLSLVLLVEVFLSKSAGEGIIGGIIWVLATYGGYQLVKSVKKEIQQADDLKKVTKELRNTNEELNNANEELKKLDKAKDEFISVASHELNTPLAAIEGYLSMILDEHMAKVDTKAKEYLGRAYQSSKRLAALIMDLLNVSRIEQGRIHMQYVETNICQLIEEVLNEIQIKADQKKIKLESTCSSKEIPKTWVDMARTHEVITNLVGNAIKFTEKGVIKVSASKVDNIIRIEVKDSGIGISKENLEKLFHKFSQVKRDEYEKQGTGLGLYISKSYVELMNGKIWAESEGEGKGTTFVVELPILKEKPFDPHEGEGAVIRSAPNEEVMKQVMAISEKHAIKK